MIYTRKILEEWADALESGKYIQGRRILCNQNDEYCCLGVLAELRGMTLWRGNENYSNWHIYSALRSENSFNDTTLLNGKEFTPVEWNDRQMLSFPQIAAKLREIAATFPTDLP